MLYTRTLLRVPPCVQFILICSEDHKSKLCWNNVTNHEYGWGIGACQNDERNLGLPAIGNKWSIILCDSDSDCCGNNKSSINKRTTKSAARKNHWIVRKIAAKWRWTDSRVRSASASPSTSLSTEATTLTATSQATPINTAQNIKQNKILKKLCIDDNYTCGQANRRVTTNYNIWAKVHQGDHIQNISLT